MLLQRTTDEISRNFLSKSTYLWECKPSISETHSQLTPNVVTTLSLARSDSMLLQRCHNIEMNVISQRCGSIATVLVQHCSNVATLLEYYIISQHCHNVATTLKTMLYHNIHTTFRLWTLCESWCPTLKFDQTTTSRQHYHNVVAMLIIT